MALIKRVAQVAIELEGIEGTAETLAAADATIKVINPEISVDGERIPRDISSAYLGNWAGDTGARSGTISFDFELEGSGTVDTVPAWDDLMLGLGFASKTTAATNVVYSPDSTGSKASQTTNSGSVTIGLYENGIRYLLAGARGDWTLRITNGQTAVMSCTFTGKWGGLTDTALLSPTYQTEVAPTVLNASLSLDSNTSLVVREITINGGNQVELRPDINDSTGWQSAVITGRNMTGSLATEALPAGTFDWFAKATTQGHSGALSVAVGASTGNTLTIAAPAVQWGLPSGAANGGIAEFAVPIRLCRSSGDDELTITHT